MSQRSFSLMKCPRPQEMEMALPLASSAARLSLPLGNVSKANPPHLNIAKGFAEACALRRL